MTYFPNQNVDSPYGNNTPPTPAVVPVTPAVTTPPAVPALPNNTSGLVSLYSKAAGYNGPSIKDFLGLAGQASDLASVGKLGAHFGIVSDPSQYTGSATQNTQLLNLLKGFASGKVSSTGVPDSFNVGTGTIPTPKTTIDVSKLGNTPDLSSILGTSLPPGSVSSDIAGLLSLYGASSKDQQNYDTLTKKLTDNMSLLGKEGADLQAEMDKQGVGAAYDKVKELNLKAAQLQGELAVDDASTQQGLADLENQPYSKGIVGSQQDAYTKQRTLARIAKTAELSATLALSQAYQGNATLGLDLAHKAIDLKYQPIQNDIDTLKTQLTYAGNSLNKSDSARSNIISKLIELKQNDITKQKDNDKQIATLAIQAASNGAPTSIVSAMRNSADPIAAAQVGTKWLKGNLESISSSGIFTQTQLNGGASNSGLAITDFAKLSDDSKNFYINGYSQFQKIFNDIQTGAVDKNGDVKEDPQQVIDQINSDTGLTDDVKQNLIAKIKPYLPATTSGGGGFWSQFMQNQSKPWGGGFNPLNWFSQ